MSFRSIVVHDVRAPRLVTEDLRCRASRERVQASFSIRPIIHQPSLVAGHHRSPLPPVERGSWSAVHLQVLYLLPNVND